MAASRTKRGGNTRTTEKRKQKKEPKTPQIWEGTSQICAHAMGMNSVAVHEVVHTVHMTLDMAHLRGQVVDVLITDLAKYFYIIARVVHPVGSHIGLGTKDHLFTYTEGYK